MDSRVIVPPTSIRLLDAAPPARPCNIRQLFININRPFFMGTLTSNSSSWISSTNRWNAAYHFGKMSCGSVNGVRKTSLYCIRTKFPISSNWSILYWVLTISPRLNSCGESTRDATKSRSASHPYCASNAYPSGFSICNCLATAYPSVNVLVPEPSA